MDFQESLQWLYARYSTHGTKLGLERIQRLCSFLGDPHRQYPSVHIAGTNGKGSVSHYLSSVLSTAGYKTGLYISPHLEEFNERITIDQIPIEDDELITIIEQLSPLVADMDAEGDSPSFFEITTAIAFTYFAKKQVDIAIIEVGLGGTYDATNIITPLISIITNISLEHTKHLGPTVQHIAKEKAGIIKSGVPVTTAATDPSYTIIKKIADAKASPVTHLTHAQWVRLSHTPENQTFKITTSSNTYKVSSRILGEYQGENIALAIHALEHLQKTEFQIDEEHIREGISLSFNPGRMETYSTQPFILLDGAHNPAGIEMLASALHDYNYQRLILVMGVLKDKDVTRMASAISTHADVFISTMPQSKRSLPSDQLTNLVSSFQNNQLLLTTNTITEALDTAIGIYRQGDLICITGSLFTVGEARKLLHHCLKINPHQA